MDGGKNRKGWKQDHGEDEMTDCCESSALTTKPPRCPPGILLKGTGLPMWSSSRSLLLCGLMMLNSPASPVSQIFLTAEVPLRVAGISLFSLGDADKKNIKRLVRTGRVGKIQSHSLMWGFNPHLSTSPSVQRHNPTSLKPTTPRRWKAEMLLSHFGNFNNNDGLDKK